MVTMHYQLCINRNILECKALNNIKNGKTSPSINRNILECKDNSDSCLSNCFNVLIETYWNVKMSPAEPGRNEKMY